MDILLKSSELIAIFYLFYHFILSKETFYNFNRVFLIVGIILSIGLPFIIIPIYTTYTFNNTVSTDDILQLLDNFTDSKSEINISAQSIMIYPQLLGLIFFWGTFFMGIKFIISLMILNSTIKNQSTISKHGYKLIESKE